MNFQKLRYFISVAKNLNFTKAAEECHIAQTAMSRQIASMEKELEIKLFNRDNRSVSLTPAGMIFYDEIVVLLEKYREAVDKSRNVYNGMAGVLKIGIGLYERSFVSELVQEFFEMYPAIKVSVAQYQYKDLMNSLKNGIVDVIFALPLSVQCVSEDDVEIQKLFTSETCVVVNRKHRFAQMNLVPISLIRDECIITICEDDGPCSMEQFQRQGERYGAYAKKLIQANSLEAAFLMVEAGIGVAFMPHFLKKELSPKLTMIRQKAFPEGKFVAMSLRRNQNPATKMFIRVIQSSNILWKNVENEKILQKT